ncbi:MAG TPA: 30S ribosomal protein S2, partial [Candidatus Omnitrophota bacterium]|nr:30S ribosomal protein S2 [Candidatus Omnitrophota bacterium]
EAGVHFGHQTQRWNPKMKKYIFGERNGIYIINLEITLACLEKALQFIKQVATEGKSVLFVGTKKQAQEPIRAAAESCGMPFVNQRWLGGMLTNFETIRKSIKKLDEIDKMEQDGSFQFITKKEGLALRKEREKLEKNLSGIRAMKKLPSALFVIDAELEKISLAEARKLGIPIVAVLDTNGNPDGIDFPLPGNDDAIKAIRLFCEAAADAVREGRLDFEKNVREKEEAEAQSSDDAAPEEAIEIDETLEENIVAEIEPEVEKPKVKKISPKKDTVK